MTKILYEKPICQTLVIRFGGSLMTVSGQNEKFQPGGSYSGGWDDEDEEENY